MKKLILFLILAILWAGCAMAYDFSAVCESGQRLYYDITSSISPYTVKLTKENESWPFYNTFPAGNLTIPSAVTYNGNTYYVTSIGNMAFYGCSGLTSVTIPNSVTSIRDYAFRDCSGLTSATIGNSVESIGNYAFQGCSELTTVTIPNSVTSIGNSAFYNCIGLTSVTIGNSVESIGNYAFQGCSELTTVTIPNSVTSIGNSAFYNCIGLTSVTIGSGVTNIGGGAFYGCSGLTEVTIGSSVTSIGGYAFYGCNGLRIVNYNATNCTYFGGGSSGISGNANITTLSIGENVETIPDSAFYGCSGLTTVNYNATNCTYFGGRINGITYNTNITTLSIGGNVETIPNSAFYGCSGLTSVTIPNSVTSIGREAFRDCSGLTSATIGNSVESIGNNAFQGCSELTTVTIPNSVTSIGNYAFYNCIGLTSVVIGESLASIGASLASIGASAFERCSAMRTMTLGSNVATIGNRAFAGCTGLFMATVKPELPPMIQSETFENVSTTAVIKVPCGSVPYYNAAQYWNVFTNVQGDMVYTLTVGSNDDIMGYATVTLAPTCANPTGIITATANNGYHFVSWNDENTENPRQITVTSDATYIASFDEISTIPEYTITVMSANPNRGTVTGGGTYPEGTDLTIEATALEGFEFVSWSDENTENPRQITVTADATYIASFDEVSTVPEYTITVMSANPNRGTVTGGGTYPEGTVVTIEATAFDGFEFVSWSDENTENPRQITVTADATYVASFDPATGIEENTAFEIALFPNPANDILNITYSETISEIEIVNTLGQVVKRIEINSDNAVCKVEDLKAGVYFVKIYGNPRTSTGSVSGIVQKFIKE